MVFHCLFEQSGTFKNEAKKLGYEAYDYDIQNEFGETDHVVDLFAEIRGGMRESLVFSIVSALMTLYLHSFHVQDLRQECHCGLGERHNNKRIGPYIKNLIIQ